MINLKLSLVLNIFEQTNLLMNKPVFITIIIFIMAITKSYCQDFSTLWHTQRLSTNPGSFAGNGQILARK